MTTLGAFASSGETTTTAIRWINRGLEFLWLLTLVAVPLAFVNRESFLSELELAYVDVPKTVLLRTLAGLIATLWVIEWVLQRHAQTASPLTGWLYNLKPQEWFKDLIDWLRGDPFRWVTLAVVLYLASTLLSTALSESFNVSMWGLVPGQDTYPAYTIICYVTLFGVVATHVKNKDQVIRLLWAVALMGVLVSIYSWAQFYGHDVFNLRETLGGRKSSSTLGNSILAGGLLLMTTTVSLTAATIALGLPIRNRGFWVRLVLWTLIVTMQMTALVLSSGRGSWGASIVATAVLIVLMAIFAQRGAFVRMAVLWGLAAGLSAALISMPPPIPAGGPTRIPTPLAPSLPSQSSPSTTASILAQAVSRQATEIPPPSEASPLSEAVSGRAESLWQDGLSARRGVGATGLSGRVAIWEISGRLIADRPWFESDEPSLSFLRPVIGYGPDMFKYTYLLERRRETQDQSVVSERFAHNILVHQWVELGFLGFLTTLGLFAAPVAVSGFLLLFRRRDELPLSRLVVLGFMAVLAGRFVEQMVGVAAISDLTLFFVLLGLFAALPTVANGPETSPPPSQVSVEGRRRRVSSAKAQVLNLGAQPILLIVMSLCLIAGIGVLTWTKSINYLAAGFQARDGLDSLTDGELQTSLDSLDRAIDLAPDVFIYNNLRAAVYSIYRLQDDLPRESKCAQLVDSKSYNTCLARQEYLSNLQASERRSLDWRPRLNLARSTLTLASLEGDPKIADEATRYYREVAQLDPKTWWHWEWLAAAYLQLGQPDAAFEPLEQSLGLLDGTPRSASSRLLQGMAYLGVDEPRAALRSLNDAIRLNPKLSDAYTNRGAAYNVLGRYERGIQDLDEAIKLDPYSTTAYNNRGNAYGNLDQFEKAIEDYAEAIRLDPRSTLAYANRALALTYQGMDDEAQMDIARAKELGLDTTSILAIMEDVKNNR